jgi:hypothetical protein
VHLSDVCGETLGVGHLLGTIHASEVPRLLVADQDFFVFELSIAVPAEGLGCLLFLLTHCIVCVQHSTPIHTKQNNMRSERARERARECVSVRWERNKQQAKVTKDSEKKEKQSRG